MSDEVTPETGEEVKSQESEPERLDDELAKWKQLARQNESRAKANAEAAKRLAEIEEANKSEAEKVAERLATAERRAAEAERKALLLQVAAEKGLTPRQAARLQGETAEELAADADDLLAEFKPAESAGRPKESGRVAGMSDDAPVVDPKKLAAQIWSATHT